MNEDLIVGLLATAIPLFAVGYLMLRRNAGIFRMFIAMLLIGLGYLTATGAMNDIGASVMGKVHQAIPETAPVTAPVSAPVTAPATPPAAPAPAP